MKKFLPYARFLYLDFDKIIIMGGLDDNEAD
eukprot:CAMPEP_0116889396 /NCGR_PEP_ID=MMETSP0463-20121206/24849_1 /TAXON_ID=181622 /ORGANISM="Strombidinopsis sp, Strain SopsisLIS2011" /LENGTH=30 /DNA_ID= /DNA_START= /DNA_END= /DNA_ORIENTATION=